MVSVYVVLVISEGFSRLYGPPEFVPRYTLYPATVDVLAVQERLTACEPPAMEMDRGEFVAVLAMVAVPVKLPVVVGEKVSDSGTDCPAPMV
jgi:hypothetical protein